MRLQMQNILLISDATLSESYHTDKMFLSLSFPSLRHVIKQPPFCLNFSPSFSYIRLCPFPALIILFSFSLPSAQYSCLYVLVSVKCTRNQNEMKKIHDLIPTGLNRKGVFRDVAQLET